MKYIMFDVGSEEFPILFPDAIRHVEIAGMIKNKILSAGFVEQTDKGKWECFGESEGLKIKSRPQDTRIVHDNLQPWGKI